MLATTLPAAGDPRLKVAFGNTTPVPAGESATLSATVTNNSDSTIVEIDPRLSLEAEGITVGDRSGGSNALPPGGTATWTWRVSADPATPPTTAPARIDVTALHQGIELTATNRTSVRTIPAAPAGLRYLSFTATASASSVEANLDRLAAHNVNDGDLTTRWASNYSDNQWVQLELAEPAEVASVRLFWEQACTSSYRIQVSNDGTSWRDAAAVDQSNCKDDTVALDSPDPVKFVRMQGTKRATGFGYSLYEFWAFGPAS